MTLLTSVRAAMAVASTLIFNPHLGSAADWVVEPARSSIHFDYVRDGMDQTGRFATFEGMGTFNPDAPEAATLALRIDTTSIDLNSSLLSAVATSAEWFDSKSHRYIQFTLNGLKPAGLGRYEAKGVLQVRGTSRPIAATIALDVENGAAMASGTLTLTRWDYLLGVGPSSVLANIGPDVAVRFVLHAKDTR